MGFVHCKHYNGRDLFLGKTNGKCLAGVDPIYSFCGGNRTGWVRKVPCLRTNETEAVCPAAEYPTMEEEKQRQEDFSRYIDDFLNWMPKAREAMIATGSDGGCMDCPKCGQGLRWSKARCNGHIHAKCDTEGCLSWME